MSVVVDHSIWPAKRNLAMTVKDKIFYLPDGQNTWQQATIITGGISLKFRVLIRDLDHWQRFGQLFFFYFGGWY